LWLHWTTGYKASPCTVHPEKPTIIRAGHSYSTKRVKFFLHQEILGHLDFRHIFWSSCLGVLCHCFRIHYISLYISTYSVYHSMVWRILYRVSVLHVCQPMHYLQLWTSWNWTCDARSVHPSLQLWQRIRYLGNVLKF